MAIYGVDVASYQGRPSWPAIRNSGVRFAFSKVTESTNYVNPTWAHNKAGMAALGEDFLPGAYHFLHGGNGAAQARYFLDHAGDLDGFAVALDVEASGAGAATAREWVAEFKRLTGGHPVIGYYPRWYWEQTGRPDLSFFDSIWQSRYVNGSGTPSQLYSGVPASWWTAFGGEPISILQFSSSGTVPGISGRCDVNAYRGTLDQLKALALKEDDMPLSSEDIEKIANAAAEKVWTRDGLIAAPPNKVAEGNTHWTGGSYEYWAYQQGTAILSLVTELAKRAEVDIDEAAVAQALAPALLAALTPKAIADAVSADVVPELADELARRMAS